MGILLAYALLSVVIQWYNRLVSRPITAAAFNTPCSNDSQIKPIGITPKDRSISQSDDWEIDLSENTIDMNLVVEVYTRCREKFRLMKNLTSMGLHNFKDSMLHFTLLILVVHTLLSAHRSQVFIRRCTNTDCNLLV